MSRQEKRDRPAGEIEVTEEMIESGLDALSANFSAVCYGGEESQRKALVAIFVTMRKAQLTSGPGTH